MLALLLEVVLIRWIPSEVRIVGYFLNFVLLACFFGMGFGLLRPEGGSNVWLLPALLATLVLTHLLSYLGVRTSSEEIFFLGYDFALPQVPLWFCLLLIFVACAATFVLIGREMAGYFNALPPLSAYSWNIAGSILGTLLMPFFSWMEWPPWTWLAAVVALAAFLPMRSSRERIVALAAGGLCIAMVAGAGSDAFWSPYQKLRIQPLYYNPGIGAVFPWMEMRAKQHLDTQSLPPEAGFNISVNEDFFQSPMDLSPAGVARWPALDAMRRQYELPYTFGSHDDVLIVGAGSGNDVAAALRAGARHVDAVEIDPMLLRIGAQRHPEHPYDDPRVTVWCDDARAFFKKSTRRYDVAVFGLLDSHMLTSRMSSVRLDSYVYTRDSLLEVSRLLKPDGLVFMEHGSAERWTTKRLFYMLSQVFGRLPYFYSHFNSNPVGTILISGPGLERIKHREVDFEEGLGSTVLPTDDWPFFYLRERGVPREYLLILGGLAILCALTMMVTGTLRRVDPPFFLLGAAFMLIETRSITAAALLMGSTWMVATVIIVVVLLMILAANLTLLRFSDLRVSGLFVVLGLTLLGNALLPLGILLSFPLFLRAILGAIWLTLPLYCAGLVFGRQFVRSSQRGEALGSNLLGGLLGGMLEYASMAIGYAALIWLAMGIYGIAWWYWRRE